MEEGQYTEVDVDKPANYLDNQVLRKMLWLNSNLLVLLILISVNILLSIWLKEVAYQMIAFLVSSITIVLVWDKYNKKILPNLK